MDLYPDLHVYQAYAEIIKDGKTVIQTVLMTRDEYTQQIKAQQLAGDNLEGLLDL